jgi:hypothetical protein
MPLRRRKNPDMNFILQFATDGSILLKSKSFLAVQMLHNIKTMISVKKGKFRLHLMRLKSARQIL